MPGCDSRCHGKTAALDIVDRVYLYYDGMSRRLRQYLYDVYQSHRSFTLPKKYLRSAPIQIDDQDDSDSLNDFCNIFCSIGKRSLITLELIGRFPITQEIEDLVEIYGGRTNRAAGRIRVTITPGQIEVLRDLSDKLRKTSFMGAQVNNPAWLTVSARTISSLYRFMRIIKEFKHSADGL